MRYPCTVEELCSLESLLGNIPARLKELLHCANGAHLFKKDKNLPLLALFGVSTLSSKKKSDWFIDRFTPKWRTSLHRPNDWVIGITSYGGIVVLDSDNEISQWDSANRLWEFEGLTFEDWVTRLSKEGAKHILTKLNDKVEKMRSSLGDNAGTVEWISPGERFRKQ